MDKISDYPENVREIINFMLGGNFLIAPFEARLDEKYEILYSLDQAAEMYLDQDIKKPYYFIGDITSKFLGEIPNGSSEMRRGFAIFRDEQKLYEKMVSAFMEKGKLKNESADDIRTLVNWFYEDLVGCAQSRLFSPKPIAYFERMLDIYKRGGFPCGWKNNKGEKEGGVVVFSNIEK